MGCVRHTRGARPGGFVILFDWEKIAQRADESIEFMVTGEGAELYLADVCYHTVRMTDSRSQAMCFESVTGARSVLYRNKLIRSLNEIASIVPVQTTGP